MKFKPSKHKRKSIRLKWYDYSKEWLYFITISVKDKLCLFWGVKNNELLLFEAGEMIEKYWLEMENEFENVKLHNFVVMPNHLHGIVEILECIKCRGRSCVCPDNISEQNNRVNTRFTPTGWKFVYSKNSISWIIQYFKSKTTNSYIKNVNKNKRKPFNRKLWQRNYYDHIIRNEESYHKIVNYIVNNPVKWKEDKFYYTKI